MKKTIQLVTAFVTASIFVTGTAFAAKQSLECKTQLARASENRTEILPRGEAYDKLTISPEGLAKASYTFSLNNTTDLVYRLDLFIRTKPSNWNADAVAFVLETKLWDLKNNKLVATKTESSDNVRTRFLLSQLLEEDTAIIAADTPSFELRGQLLNSSDLGVVALANEGRWTEATNSALSKALVNPFTADFASVHCVLEN